MAIYIRNDIDFIIRDDIGIFIEGELESIFVETTHKGRKMLVGEIYRVPNTDPVVAIERYDNILDKIKNVHNVIIGMDQNLDLLKVNTHKHTSDFLNTIFEHSFVPCISKPTRVTHTSASLIDNIYVKVTNNNSKLNSAILVFDISDHFPIFGMVSTNCNHSSKGKSLVLEKKEIHH